MDTKKKNFNGSKQRTHNFNGKSVLCALIKTNRPNDWAEYKKRHRVFDPSEAIENDFALDAEQELKFE